MSSVSRPGVSSAMLRGDFAGGVHLRDARRQQQAGLSANFAPHSCSSVDQPILLARGVRVVAAGSQAGLTTSAPNLMNGPTMLSTTVAPLNSSVSAATVCSTSTTS